MIKESVLTIFFKLRVEYLCKKEWCCSYVVKTQTKGDLDMHLVQGDLIIIL